MIVPDPPTGVDHVFHLATPQHMLTKLWWELQRLRKEVHDAPGSIRGVEYIAYCAFNTAVTALHCGDWAWRSLAADEQANVATRFGFSLTGKPRKDLELFMGAICSAERSLEICRQIANASKHMGTDKPNETFNVETVWRFIAAGDHLAHMECYLCIQEESGKYRVEEVFADAFRYWERTFGEMYLIEGKYVGSVRNPN
jgi:hypothetical protein